MTAMGKTLGVLAGLLLRGRLCVPSFKTPINCHSEERSDEESRILGNCKMLRGLLPGEYPFILRQAQDERILPLPQDYTL